MAQEGDDFAAVALVYDAKSGASISAFELDAPVEAVTGKGAVNRDALALVPGAKEMVGVWPGEPETVARIRVFDLQTGTESRAFDFERGKRISAYRTTTRVLARRHSSGEALLFFSLWEKFTPDVVNLSSGSRFGPPLRDAEEQDPEEAVTATVRAMDANDSYLVVGLEWQRFIKKEVIKVFDLATGACLHRMGKGSSGTFVALHPNLPNLLATALAHNNTVRLWDLNSGQQLYFLCMPVPQATRFEVHAITLTEACLHVLCSDKKSPAARLVTFDFSVEMGVEETALAGALRIVNGAAVKPKKKRRGPLD